MYITDEEALSRVAALLTGRPMLACDLETAPCDAGLDDDERKRQALDPYTGRVRLLTLAAEDTDPDTGAPVIVAFVVDTWACPAWANVLRRVLTHADTTLVFHHAKFDVAWLLAAGIEVTTVGCTMLAAQLLDGGVHRQVAGYFTLEAVAERELGERLDKAGQRSDWGVPELSAEQVRYAALDAAILPPLHRALTAKLAAEGLAGAAALEFAALPAVAWLELAGAPFAVEAWLVLSDDAKARELGLAAEIAALLAGTGAVDESAGQRVNLNSPQQLKRLLADLGITVAKTDEETLVAVVDRHPVVPLILAYREAVKRANTYGVEYVAHVHPATGRIHASYRQIGAVTGRMSCTTPNLQQVPRLATYRACFRPGDGRVLVKADLSLVELCVAADLSGDERLLQAIIDGQDLHRLTAGALFGKRAEDVTAAERAFGKAVNFGTLFGQGLRGLRERALRHGLVLSEAQARQFQRRFATAWPQLDAWRRRQMQRRGSIIRTASGRIRRLRPMDPGTCRAPRRRRPPAARRIRRLRPMDPGTVRANTPIQGTAADGFKAALALLWQTRGRYPSAVPVLAVHDELVVECDAQDAETVAAWVSACLQEGMRRYLARVPARVEVTIASDWAGTAT